MSNIMSVVKVVYISGPMTGFEDLNFPAFFDAEDNLRALGYEIINPARIDQPDKSWVACMKRDIVEMMAADTVVTLPGWEKSKGAQIEVELAKRLGMQVYELGIITQTA
ncbi:hypothetical protein PAECIP111893_00283 [Paenibacillus plantiphilus]|uniref:DUF4406 domain-containing protein n=1 Tax=Paenibacillus plantiphilus TaxID=2905650 RepID=A0ABN8FW11_9BACL|nr:DUF1937 family protein [Paenibacillus plantiphilus]CAH1190340.1 hypothetical protein PAECIP111893_00283 [Paenibacillus plantiphilus]